MTSTNSVVNSVAKKLKYYFEIKRLEDGFDLSDIHQPLLDHPPLKALLLEQLGSLAIKSAQYANHARPTLQYDGLHDRALKHYFSNPEVRIKLTHLDLPVHHMHNPREQIIKKRLHRQMKKHHFLLTAPDLPPDPKKSSIPECYYIYTNAGVKLNPKLVGFGSAPKSQKKKALKGGWPLLRNAPPASITRGEAERLVNSATRLLVAAETVEHLQNSQQVGMAKAWQTNASTFETDWDTRSRSDRSQSVTEADNRDKPMQKNSKRRPMTAKHSSGQRLSSAKVKAYDDTYIDQLESRKVYQRQRSSSPSSSITTEESAKYYPPRPPRPPPQPPSSHERPLSAKHRHRTIINLPEEHINEEVAVPSPPPPKSEIGIQTDKELSKETYPMEKVVTDGPQSEYHVFVRTGNRIGASTRADVKLTIYGDKGCSPQLLLAESKHNKIKFQQGKEDLFILSAHHVGKMQKIKIGHDRHQLNYAWFLESVTIYDMKDKRIYEFPCGRWLSGQDDDQRTYRVLPVDRERAFVTVSSSHVLSTPRDQHKEKYDLNADPISPSQSDLEVMPQKGGHKKKAKHRQSIQSTSSDSSSDSSSSDDNNNDESSSKAVIQLSSSTPQTPKKNELASRKQDDLYKSKPSGRVIRFHKKGSEKVEEEVHLDDNSFGLTTVDKEKNFLAGYKAGLEAVEMKEREKKEEERTRQRQLLSGTSIHDAARNGNLERVQLLLDKFPEMKDLKDENGWTPLHLAAAHGHVDIIKWLLSSFKNNIDVETPTGYTPIHVAAMNGHKNVLMVLNAMGADTGCKTVDQQTPLHLASKSGHLPCVKWLVANGANIKDEDSFGRTAGSLADEYGQDTVADFLRVCQRDLANPSSSFAQMHKGMQHGHSVMLASIKEDDSNGRHWTDQTSILSDHPEIGSSSTDYNPRRSKSKEEILKKKKLYEEHHRHMEERGVSFLDDIRQTAESDD